MITVPAVPGKLTSSCYPTAIIPSFQLWHLWVYEGGQIIIALTRVGDVIFYLYMQYRCPVFLLLKLTV